MPTGAKADMCMSCGCLMPNVAHHFTDDGDVADIVYVDVLRAAGAAGITADEAAANVPRTLRSLSGADPHESFLAMRDRPTLFVDIDNTLADMTSAVCIALNVAFDAKYVGDQMTEYAWSAFLPTEQAAWITDQLRKPMIFTNMSPIISGVHTVQKAHAAGYTVNVVTDRPESVSGATIGWLAQHKVPYDHIGFRAPGGKGYYLVDANADNPAVLIDDNPLYSKTLPRDGVEVWSPRMPYTPTGMLTGARVFDDWHEVRTWLGV